jgi:hypothetical protein
MPRAAPSSVPKLCTPIERLPRNLEKDPRAAAYDPVTLILHGGTALEVFEREPRKADWAPSLERTLTAALKSELATLLPAADSIAVECRTRSCLFSWSGDQDTNSKVWDLLWMVSPSRHMKYIPPAEGGTAKILALFENPASIAASEKSALAIFDATDASRFEAKYDQRRRDVYRLIHAGTKAPPPWLDVSRLPH